MAVPQATHERPRHLKRDSSHLTSATASLSVIDPAVRPALLPSSPWAKRQRVSFSEDIDVRILNDQHWPVDNGSRAQDLVAEEVKIALETHRRKTFDAANAAGDSSPYEALRSVFVSAGLEDENAIWKRQDDSDSGMGTPDSRLLKQYLVALIRRAGELKGCNALVHAILDMNWFGRDESFVSLYVKFVGALGMVVPGYLRQIMDKIVRHFVSLPSIYGRIPGEPLVRKRQMLASLHSAIRYLTSLIPAATSALRDALQSNFPNHRMTDRKDYLSYLRQLLKISTHIPEVRNDILTLITERLVKIDVEIQRDLEGFSEDIEDDLMEGSGKRDNYFLDDDTTDESDDESDIMDPRVVKTPGEVAAERQLKELQDKVDKLDAGMDLIFWHYFGEGGIAKHHEDSSYDTLLSIFTTFILPTYRARHVQFLVFHFAQVDADKTAHFISRCIGLLQGTTGHSATSALAGSVYLASFLARGARIHPSLLRDVVAVLVARIDALREQYEKTARGPDIGRYMAFYTSVQALLYIFCFRWREIVFSAGSNPDEDDDLDYHVVGDALSVPGLRACLYQSIYSRLNPLKVCAPNIVKQFAAISSHIHFMFVYPLLETNKRVRLSAFRTYGGSSSGDGALARRDNALSAKGGESHHQLDAFYPFDPYYLPRSKRWLEGDYMGFRHIAGMVGEDDDDDEGEEEEDDGEDEGEEDDVDDVLSVGSESS